MKKLFSILLLLTALAGCKKTSEPQSEAGKMLARAAEWLWTQQGADGGWHSATHGLMKSGQVTTPFVLDALLSIPDSIYTIDGGKKRAALDFIRGQVNADGALGLTDPDLLEYPNYATAYGLKVMRLYGTTDDKAFSNRMRDYLLSQQFDEDRGLIPANAAYGSWGFGETELRKGHVGHVDLSHTRRVLEALAIAGGLDKETKDKARIFLARCQQDAVNAGIPVDGIPELQMMRYDGGFLYSPMVLDLNKGGLVSADSIHTFVGSYATATADGWLALEALGDKGKAQQDALQWLQDRPGWEGAAGIPEETMQEWKIVMVYYHLTVRAQVYGQAGEEGAWREEMLDFLRERQEPDGRFWNPHGAPNKENDPLLATAMVVRALVETF